MNRILWFLLLILFLLAIVVGWFFYDGWQETKNEVREFAAESTFLQAKIDLLENLENRSATDTARLQAFAMKLAIYQSGADVSLKTAFVRQGLIETISILVSNSRRKRLNEMIFNFLSTIEIKNCPEEFQELFKAFVNEFSDPESVLKTAFHKKLEDFLEDFAKQNSHFFK